MNRSLLVLGLSLAFTLSAVAQHGAGGGGGSHGMGSAMGAGNASHAGGAADMGHSNDTGNSAGSSSKSLSKESSDVALSKSPKLASNLEKLLPAGMTAQDACSGFKNLGQCVAAIHVSHNLDIPFADLKSKMTGDASVSLGKAIQVLQPQAKGKQEAKRAEKQAKQDINQAAG